MIVDVEHHAAAEELLEKGSSKSGMYCERYWDKDGKMKVLSYVESSRVEERLQFMDETGIDVAVLSTNPLKTLDQSIKWHNHCAQMIRQAPGRFVGLATIPPLGGKPAFKELERGIKELGFRGVHIPTRNEGLHLDSREMWPFYKKAAELKIPVDVHVTLDPTGYDAAHAPYALHYVIARELDMLTETFRLCLGGVLEDFPDLIFIMNHFGSGISSIMERMDAYLDFVGPGCPSLYQGKSLIRQPWREYFNKLYFNMAGREGGMAAVQCALTTIKPRRLMFGSDWPFNYDHNPKKAKKFIRDLQKLNLPQADIDAMLGGTAAKLFKIKG